MLKCIIIFPIYVVLFINSLLLYFSLFSITLELHVDSCTNLNINPSSEVKAYSKKPGQLSDISNAALLETSSIQEPTSDTESSWYSTSQLDPALDTSTAQRVNRISQMLAETQKLFA